MLEICGDTREEGFAVWKQLGKNYQHLGLGFSATSRFMGFFPALSCRCLCCAGCAARSNVSPLAAELLLAAVLGARVLSVGTKVSSAAVEILVPADQAAARCLCGTFSLLYWS